jgi:hypothetical protein
MSQIDDKLSPQQSKAVAALLTASSVAQAADEVGVTARTLFRWLDDPTFEAAYRAARREALGQAMARMQGVSSAMVSVLLQLAADRRTPPSVRFQAAAKVIELSIKWNETEDIEQRLAALEAKAAV